ncbi:PaaI family thioesterase [Spongorhabdus nitratireducens]
MSIHEAIKQARQTGDFQSVNQMIPWALQLGMECRIENGKPLFLMPPKNTNVGNPILPAIHGGVVGSFMQHAAAMHLLMTLDLEALPRMINFSIDYLHSARLVDSWASCTLERQGRRVANVGIVFWQDDPDTPVAKGRTHFRI